MFYKSMTSYSDNRKWQDVYHVPTPAGATIYLKFTDNVITEFTILSFKEK
jgi:motility quorum-sensing regulator/GCU-specific mRNA interferase toxin